MKESLSIPANMSRHPQSITRVSHSASGMSDNDIFSILSPKHFFKTVHDIDNKYLHV